MELKNVKAVIDLIGPEEFEEFQKQIIDQLLFQLQTKTGEDLAEKDKQIKAYRVSLFNLEKHIRAVLTHYEIPIEKLEKAEAEATAEAEAAPTPTPAPVPSSPREIPPAIKEVLRPTKPFWPPKSKLKPKQPTKPSARSQPVPSSDEDRELLREGILTCLAATGNRKLGVSREDIFLYLEKVMHFPVKTEYWSWITKNRVSRFEAALRFQMRKLQLAKKIRSENNFWYLA